MIGWTFVSEVMSLLFNILSGFLKLSSKKQEDSRKTSTFALLITPKPFTVWITKNCGKFFKRQEYQTTLTASWEICMQVKKQQLELDKEQQFSSVQLLSRVRLFATSWIAARQASLSITISRSAFKLMSIESVMPFSHLILCRPLFLLPPIPPSISVFSNESTLYMRWPKYWVSALASFLPKNTEGWSPLE